MTSAAQAANVSGRLLRRARQDAGFTQAELAGRAGVTQPEVSAYENGRRQPTVPTLQRLVAATGHRLHVEALTEPSDAPDTYRPLTLSSTSRALLTQTDESTRWRILLEFVQGFRREPPARRWRLLRREPERVDGCWDAMLAAVAEHLAFHHELRCPAWVAVKDRVLRTAWFPNDLLSARPAAMETSPASFRRRGIFIDAHDLDTA